MSILKKPHQVDMYNIETSSSRYVHTSTWQGLFKVQIVIIWSICACTCVVNLYRAAALQEPARFCHGNGKRPTRYFIVHLTLIAHCFIHPYDVSTDIN